MTYREADLGRVRTVPVGSRRNKVDPSLLASPPGGDQSFDAFLDSLPDVLAARDLRAVIAGVVSAARARRGVVLLVGGHVIKVGLGPLLADWLRRGIITHLALNGAAAIHDFELAAFGGTSEDVESGLADGTFGMARELGPQGVTVEDTMSMVHLSAGMNAPASEHLISEPMLVARMAAATLKHSRTPWLALASNYAAIRDKIYQPFFTTKPTGEGTGLGLAICHEIIAQNHGGRLDLETEEGQFTEFVITLPRRREA